MQRGDLSGLLNRIVKAVKPRVIKSKSFGVNRGNGVSDHPEKGQAHFRYEARLTKHGTYDVYKVETHPMLALPGVAHETVSDDPIITHASLAGAKLKIQELENEALEAYFEIAGTDNKAEIMADSLKKRVPATHHTKVRI